MIETWEAKRLEKRLETGRTRPLLIDCEHTSTVTRRERFVVKLLGLREVTTVGLCNEFLGHAVARHCGAVTAEAALISVSQAFIDANSAAFAGWGINPSAGIGFGCRYIPGLGPMPSNPTIDGDAVAGAALVYGIDMLTQNADRRRGNPNCAYGDSRVFTVYDFDQAFGFRYGILNPPAWKVTDFRFQRDHVFFEALRNKQLDWGSFRAAAGNLTPALVSEWIGSMPETWQAEAEPIRQHFVTLADRLDDFTSDLQRSLA